MYSAFVALVRSCLAVALLAAPLFAGHAQDYPDKPLRVVVPFGAGSATDGLARAVGEGIAKQTGQNVIVDNRPGANGIIAAENVAKSSSDGHSILFGTHTTHAANPWLYKKLPYDPVKDFEPVSALARGWSFLVVHPKSPARTLGDLIEMAKRAPGTLTYGAGGASSRVSVELFAQMAGIKLVYVAYKGNPLAVNDLVAGHIDLMITDSATGLPQIKAGALRALAYTGPMRSPLAPDVPTFDEAGVKGYENSYWFAAYLPAGSPAPIVGKLNKILVEAARGEAAKRYFASTGLVGFTTAPDGLARFQAEQSKILGEVIRGAGIDPE